MKTVRTGSAPCGSTGSDHLRGAENLRAQQGPKSATFASARSGAPSHGRDAGGSGAASSASCSAHRRAVALNGEHRGPAREHLTVGFTLASIACVLLLLAVATGWFDALALGFRDLMLGDQHQGGVGGSVAEQPPEARTPALLSQGAGTPDRLVPAPTFIRKGTR